MQVAHIREVTIEKDGQVRLDGLPVRAGDRVNVFVIPRHAAKPGESRYPLQGAFVRYDNPFEPAADPQEWEAYDDRT